MIERDLAEELDLPPELVEEVKAYNEDASLKWLFSFLSADRKKTYCLYEASDPDDLRKQAEDLGFPADVIIEVTEANPEMFTSGASATGHLAGQ